MPTSYSNQVIKLDRNQHSMNISLEAFMQRRAPASFVKKGKRIIQQNAGLLNSVQPAITMALAWLILRTTITRRQIMGLVVAIAGVVVIIGQGNLDTLQRLTFVAEDFLVLGPFSSWALYAVLVKRAPTDIEPFALFLAITVAGLIGMIPFYAGEILFTDLRVEFNFLTIASVLYINHFWLNRAIKYESVRPIVAVMNGVVAIA